MIDGVRLDVFIRLSVQRALLGMVSPSLRAVSCEAANERIRLRFVFDGPIDEDEEHDARAVGTEVIADFPASWTIDEQIVRIDYPADRREGALALWAYMRKEE